jgi:Glycosyl hydrolase family 26
MNNPILPRLGDARVARATQDTAPTATEPSVSLSGSYHPSGRTPMSRKRFLATGGAALAGLGMLPLIDSRRAAAATVAAKVQCDSMTRSWGSGMLVISDINADNGKALRYTARAGAAKSGVSFSTSANTVTLRLKTIKDSVWPNVSVLIDGVEVAAAYSVASSAYQTLTMSLSSPISQGMHKVEVAAPGGMGGNEEVIADWVRFDDTISTTPPPAPTSRQIALGVYAGNDQWGNTSRIDAYKALVGGITPKIIHVFQPFKSAGGTYVQLAGLGTQVLYDKYPGAVIMVSWEPRQLGNTSAKMTAQIASGQHDAYIRQQAQRIVSYGKRINIRFGHEMNIDQFPWGSRAKNTMKQNNFKVMWKKVWNIFQQEGANVFADWTWCPNMRVPNSPNASPMAHWYPGDAYVDYLGVDCYNWAASRNMAWYSPAQLYPQALQEVAACDLTGTKGIIIGETGCHSVGGDKSQWFRDMRYYFGSAPEAERVKGIVYFHYNMDGAQWRVDYPATALQSYKEMLSDPSYQAGLSTE